MFEIIKIEQKLSDHSLERLQTEDYHNFVEENEEINK